MFCFHLVILIHIIILKALRLSKVSSFLFCCWVICYYVDTTQSTNLPVNGHYGCIHIGAIAKEDFPVWFLLKVTVWTTISYILFFFIFIFWCFGCVGERWCLVNPFPFIPSWSEVGVPIKLEEWGENSDNWSWTTIK